MDDVARSIAMAHAAAAHRLRIFFVGAVISAATWAFVLVGVYFTVLHSGYMLILAAVLASNALVGLLGLRMLDAGRPRAAIITFAVDLWGVLVAVTLVAPRILPITILEVPIVLLLALPYTSNKQLRALVYASPFVSLAIALLGTLQDWTGLGSKASWIPHGFIIIATPLIVVFMSLSLVHSRAALVDALEDAERTNQLLLESERSLERKVEERTRQLGEARDEALSATEAKSAFLSTMSHEIRTPLNAVIGMTYLLGDTQLTGDQPQFVQTIRTSGEALLSIINDVLDFSKIEAGRLDLETEAFDFRQAVEDVVDVVAPSAAAKGIELASYVHDEVPAGVVGDVTRVRQVLLNLLNNAVKFTSAGEVVLIVGAEPVVDDTVQLRASVRDTGIGVAPERIDQLFESFTQADASTTRRFGGTGLGLAISRRLTELMNGRLWAESEGTGRGSTFHLDLELPVVNLPPRHSPDQVSLLSDRRVLVVDDNATNRYLLRMQVTSWGMYVRDTEYPAEALAWINRGDPFDLAIFDMQMPDMDGLELAHEVRARRGRDFPVLMMTSIGRPDRPGAAAEVEWLTKPVKPSQLFNSVIGLLEAEHGAIARMSEVAIVDDPGGASEFDPGMGERHPLRVLIAEDNALNQQMALKILARLGYAADVAGDGLETLAFINASTYDVVLLDVQMPEIDGLEVARRVCAQYPRDRRPRLVAMTANAMTGDRKACLDAGMDDYLPKPVRIKDLMGALERTSPISEPGVISLVDEAAGDERVSNAGGPPRPGDSIAAALRRVLGDDDATVVRMLDTFVATGAPLLDELVAHHMTGDDESFTRGAHTLKSNAASLGAGELASVCAQLEDAGRTGRMGGVDPLIARARALLDALLVDVEQLRAQLL